jgi:hypothetical protein
MVDDAVADGGLVPEDVVPVDVGGDALDRLAGRDVRYRATPEPLGGAVAWMLGAGAQWDRRLDRLRAQVEHPAT